MLSPIAESICPYCAATVSAALSWHPSEDARFAHEAHVYVEIQAAEQPETHIVPNGCHHYKITPTPNGASVTITFSEQHRG